MSFQWKKNFFAQHYFRICHFTRRIGRYALCQGNSVNTFEIVMKTFTSLLDISSADFVSLKVNATDALVQASLQV